MALPCATRSVSLRVSRSLPFLPSTFELVSTVSIDPVKRTFGYLCPSFARSRFILPSTVYTGAAPLFFYDFLHHHEPRYLSMLLLLHQPRCSFSFCHGELASCCLSLLPPVCLLLLRPLGSSLFSTCLRCFTLGNFVYVPPISSKLSFRGYFLLSLSLSNEFVTFRPFPLFVANKISPNSSLGGTCT